MLKPMLKLKRFLLAVLMVWCAAAYAQNAPESDTFVPLLPNDTPENFTYTKAKFQEQLAAVKTKQVVSPNLASLPGTVPGRPTYMMEIASAADFLLFLYSSQPTSSSPVQYFEGEFRGMGVSGWPWLLGDWKISRSTVGEIGLALLHAYNRYRTVELESAIHQLASELKNDYANDGPLNGQGGLPFPLHIVFISH